MSRVTEILMIMLFASSTAYAGYTSEETDEKSKSVYSEMTSILKSTDQSKHHRKHTYTPCTNGECPCHSTQGCSPLFGNVPSAPSPYTTSDSYVSSHVSNSDQRYSQPKLPQLKVDGNTLPFVMPYPMGVYDPRGYVLPAPTAIPNLSAISPQSSQNAHDSNGYMLPATQGSYGYWPSYPAYYVKPGELVSNKIPATTTIPHQPSQGHYASNSYIPNGALDRLNSHHSHQNNRGYSTYDHSLKTNSEYTETGTHTGPLQYGNNGYGSGYGGGYNGLFNRPGYL